MQDLFDLEKRLNVSFNDYSLLSRALTHRSFKNETANSKLEDNERLEFLGDAILDFLVGDYLYHRLPEADEGELTALRAALVRTETLADFAQVFDLGVVLRLGQGEADNGGRQRKPILCATFEALVGAIYLDQGLAALEPLMAKLIPNRLDKILAQSLHKDNKSEFQIWAQAHFNITPRYQVIATSGPDHNKQFEVQVSVGDKVWGAGIGSSKQAAAQQAATAAMDASVLYDDELEEE